jgi:hypothetical protein
VSFFLREDKLLSVFYLKISGIYIVCMVTVREFSVIE